MSEQELSRQKEISRALTVDREEMKVALEEANAAERVQNQMKLQALSGERATLKQQTAALDAELGRWMDENDQLRAMVVKLEQRLQTQPARDKENIERNRRELKEIKDRRAAYTHTHTSSTHTHTHAHTHTRPHPHTPTHTHTHTHTPTRPHTPPSLSLSHASAALPPSPSPSPNQAQGVRAREGPGREHQEEARAGLQRAGAVGAGQGQPRAGQGHQSAGEEGRGVSQDDPAPVGG
jgi:regulator of replication initiation timing